MRPGSYGLKLARMIPIILGAISDSAIVSTIVRVIVLGMICWLLWWLIDYVKIPEPFNKFARVLIAVLAVVLLISLLLNLTGTHW